VLSRILSGDRAEPDLNARVSAKAIPDAKLQALRLEVERVSGARSQAERAAQLARVLDAVSVLAKSHGLSEAELATLRAGKRVGPRLVAGLKRQLKQRARGAVAQMWSASAAVVVRDPRVRLTPGSIATELLKRKLLRTTRPIGSTTPARARVPFVVRVGRPSSASAGRLARGRQLIAASLLHLPRLQRQVMAIRALRRGAGVALSTAKLMRLPSSPTGREHVTAASVLLWSGRSGLQLTYEVATAGAQLFLRSYVYPRVLRYLSAGLSSGVALREVATARVLRPRTDSIATRNI
jgi:hypothetical protein